MKRTNRKVEIVDGVRHIVRTVYENTFGKDCFKYDGKTYQIFKRENGTYNAPYFNGVKYIAE